MNITEEAERVRAVASVVQGFLQSGFGMVYLVVSVLSMSWCYYSPCSCIYVLASEQSLL